MIIKKEFILDGLDCANCAGKIENKVKEISGVESSYMNFISKILVINIKEESNYDEIKKTIRKIVKDLEPDVIVREKGSIKKVSTASGKKVAVKNNSSCSIDGDNCFINDNIIEHVHSSNGNKKHEIYNKNHNEETNLKEDEGDDHEHSHGENNKKDLIKIIVAAIIFIFASIIKLPLILEFTLFFISYIIVGGEVLLKAFRNIMRGQVFDENFLMGIATIGAFSIKQYPEGVAVMLFYQIGEYIQGIAVNRSRKSISSLMDIRPDYANLIIGNNNEKVSPEEVKVGDYILVKPGEKVPLDGVVVEGKSMVDTSALTGESVPREIEAGKDILSGFINKNGMLTIKVTKEFQESTVSKILDLVQNASSRKAETENFITKFAKYYTPAVVILAVLIAIIPPLVISGATFSEYIYKSLVFLVISCPCALVISIPLGFFGGIGGSSKKGILIKGSNYLEALNRVEVVVFDKTGTLTKGVFKVTEINSQDKANKNQLLEVAAYAEVYSNHPIALSIIKEYGKQIDKSLIENYDEISGYGIKVNVKGENVLAGNAKLMIKENISFNNIAVAGTVIHVAVNRIYLGYIIISDELKDDSIEAISKLKAMGIKKIVMLTGDNKEIAKKISQKLGIDEYYAELLPMDKVEKLEVLEKYKSPKGKLLFVGDGINDAPVIARADIGIAMGGLGSDAAIEAADVVIMTDEPSKIALAIKIAKRTRVIVWENIIFAMVIKVMVLLLATGGLATIWEAVFADVGVTVIAVINAMRVLNISKLK